MDSVGCPMDSFGFPMDSYGFLINSYSFPMDPYGFPMESLGISRNLQESAGISPFSFSCIGCLMSQLPPISCILKLVLGHQVITSLHDGLQLQEVLHLMVCLQMGMMDLLLLHVVLRTT